MMMIRFLVFVVVSVGLVAAAAEREDSLESRQRLLGQATAAASEVNCCAVQVVRKPYPREYMDIRALQPGSLAHRFCAYVHADQERLRTYSSIVNALDFRQREADLVAGLMAINITEEGINAGQECLNMENENLERWMKIKRSFESALVKEIVQNDEDVVMLEERQEFVTALYQAWQDIGVSLDNKAQLEAFLQGFCAALHHCFRKDLIAFMQNVCTAELEAILMELKGNPCIYGCTGLALVSALEGANVGKADLFVSTMKDSFKKVVGGDCGWGLRLGANHLQTRAGEMFAQSFARIYVDKKGPLAEPLLAEHDYDGGKDEA